MGINITAQLSQFKISTDKAFCILKFFQIIFKLALSTLN